MLNDFLIDYFLPIVLIAFLILAFILIVFAIRGQLMREDYLYNKIDYIQNLEQKVNIYEQSYDNYVLEDSLVQEV